MSPNNRRSGVGGCMFLTVVCGSRFCLLMAFSGLVILGTLLASPTSSLTPEDITLRDALIVEQEALLNVYRCRFDIDTEEVPGGCVYGQPALPAEVPQQFEEIPSAEGIVARDAFIAEQEVLLNFYRCRLGIDAEVVLGGCGSDAQPGAGGGDPAVQPNWHSFEGHGLNYPYLGRPWLKGTYTPAAGWVGAPEGVVPELWVACFDADSSEPKLKAYVAWNWFARSTISTYELDVELPGSWMVAYDAFNSNSNQASFLRYDEDVAEFANLLIYLDGEEITVSSFIAFGGYTISATFDLTGSSSAIRPVLEECPPVVE